MVHFKRVFRYIMVYISLISTISFALFIFEESLQVMMFSIWPAKDAREWQLVWDTADMMEDTNATMDTINCSIGWLNPLSFMAYRAYAKATTNFIKSYRILALNRDPSLTPPNFVLKRHFTFKRLSSGSLDGESGYWLHEGKYAVWGRKEQLGKSLSICVTQVSLSDPYRLKEVPCE